MKQTYWIASVLIVLVAAYLIWDSWTTDLLPVTAMVKGKVTLDGSPVAKGTIQFLPDRSAGTASALEIKNGEYQGKAYPGVSSVVITSPGPKMVKVPMEGTNGGFLEVPEELIPERYNKMTGLQREVKSGENEFDFPLKTPPAAMK